MAKLEQGVNKKIVTMIQDPTFSIFFEKYSNLLRIFYDYLVKRTFVPLSFSEKPTISLEGLSLFVADFNICPSIFHLREIILIYKSLTKMKPPAIIKDSVSSGLDYKEFIEFLVRIAIKGQNAFNQIGLKIKESGTIIEKDLKSIIEKEGKGNMKRRHSMEEHKEDFKGEKAILDRYKNVFDEYEEIEKTSILTMEGMFYYLGLPLDPDDKACLEKRLKDIRIKKTIPNKYKKKGILI